MRIKDLRTARGLTQEALGFHAGVRTATISEAERDGNARMETLAKIAAALDVHFLDLFADDRDDPDTQGLISRVRELSPDEKRALAVLLPQFSRFSS